MNEAGVGEMRKKEKESKVNFSFKQMKFKKKLEKFKSNSIILLENRVAVIEKNQLLHSFTNFGAIAINLKTFADFIFICESIRVKVRFHRSYQYVTDGVGFP